MKKNDMEKYFNQKMISWLDVVLASIAVGGWAFSSFVWGGGRIGIPIFVAAAAVLGAKRSMRIKDSEFDGALAKMLSENGIDVEDENTVFSFDYQSRLVKGRDQKLRARCSWATRYAFQGDRVEITAWKLDVQSGKTEQFSYIVPKEEPIAITEERIRVFGRFKQTVRISHSLFAEDISVSTEDVNSDRLIKRIQNGDY